MTDKEPDQTSKPNVASSNDNTAMQSSNERRESHSFGNVPQYQSSAMGDERPYQVEDGQNHSSSGKSNVAIIGTFEDGVGYFGHRSFRILSITMALLFYSLMALSFWYDTDGLEDIDKAYNT